jgi:uncharacterized phiE125 gp8 family phage protein
MTAPGPSYLITAPETEPITLAQAKAHLRVEITDDNDLIEALIVAARQLAEQRADRSMAEQGRRLILDHWPSGPLYLPRPPIISVDAITYTDTTGAETEIAAEAIRLDGRGRVSPAPGYTWPAVALAPGGLVIDYTAGYTAEALPATDTTAMLLLIGHWYEHREAIIATGAAPKELPFAVTALLNSHAARGIK